jgi:hypothetical protein
MKLLCDQNRVSLGLPEANEHGDFRISGMQPPEQIVCACAQLASHVAKYGLKERNRSLGQSTGVILMFISACTQMYRCDIGLSWPRRSGGTIR